MTLRLLEQLNFPDDLKTISNEQAYVLASELRQEIIHVVSKTGGHLAPNLGVVELTLALHMELDTPHDKLIWDVGHQSYVHKMVTGRLNQFHTLREYRGLSGYTRRDESVYDPFGAGHSSTSISAALGFATARDLAGQKHTVVAVIGDGSMGGGMAFEALNCAGQLDTDLIVVLNDNEMCIAPNVGALSGYLNRLRVDPTVQRVKAELELALKRIPAIGPRVAKTVENIKEAFKYLVVPGMLFEELGFTYIGPINGHNIPAIRRAIQDAKLRRGPVLLHVVTTKGKGYVPAETNPKRFHGTGPFILESGEPTKVSTIPSYTDVFSEALVEYAEHNEKIVAITAAMPDGTGLEAFKLKYPNRFLDVGIAEQHAVTMGAGMAAAGYRPVVAIYSSFLQRAYDQILHDVCLQNLPVVLMVDRAGLVGEDGATHHGIFDLAYSRHIPNITVMAPKDGNELRSMLKFALSYDKPVLIRYPKSPVPQFDIELDSPIEIGRAEVLKRGGDLALLAVGAMVERALKASDILARAGISSTVVNMRFVKPLDNEILMSVATEIGKIITVEDHVLQGGFGSAVAEFCCKLDLQKLVVRNIGIPDVFVEHGNRDFLLDEYGLSVDNIVQASLEVAGRKLRARTGSNLR
jgi:1-deoxy-D-xylulose-5-phosphate synthase